jgi:hypothetical protein
MPSLYQFSAVDAASAVDYSRDVGIEDGVVNSPPPKLHSHMRAPSPSPLSKEKRTLVRLATASMEDGVTRRGPSQRLRMEASPQEALPKQRSTHTSGSERSSPVHYCPSPICVGNLLVTNEPVEFEK